MLCSQSSNALVYALVYALVFRTVARPLLAPSSNSIYVYIVMDFLKIFIP